MTDLTDAARAHPDARAAMARVEAAAKRRDAVKSEVASLEADLRALDVEMEATTKAGDPEGEIREMSKRRRELADELEDASADLAAQEAAWSGALRAHHRAVLDAMPDVWSAQPRREAEQAVREGLASLADALDRLEGLTRQYRQLGDLARHITSRLLEGEGAQTPQMEEPSAGIPPATLAELSRAVRAARSTLPAESTENAA